MRGPKWKTQKKKHHTSQNQNTFHTFCNTTKCTLNSALGILGWEQSLFFFKFQYNPTFIAISCPLTMFKFRTESWVDGIEHQSRLWFAMHTIGIWFFWHGSVSLVSFVFVFTWDWTLQFGVSPSSNVYLGLSWFLHILHPMTFRDHALVVWEKWSTVFFLNRGRLRQKTYPFLHCRALERWEAVERPQVSVPI